MTEGRESQGWGGLAVALPWLGLSFAFSPVIVDLLRSGSDHAFGWTLLVTPVLLARLLALEPGRQDAAPRFGLPLVLTGLLLGLLGIAVDSASIARIGLPVAAVGMAFWTGVPRPATAALSFWLVPIPTALLLAAPPSVESGLVQIAVVVLRPLVGEIQVAGPLMTIGAEQLQLGSGQNGLHVAVMLAQIGWYAAIRLDTPLARGALRAGLATLLAPPLQLIGVGVGIVLLATLGAQAAQVWLTYGVALAVAVLGFAWVEWQAVRAASAGPED